MNNNQEANKKEILKLLGMIGIDTRFISYTSSKIYINNQRFSKFSKKREKIFKKYYPNIEIIRSTLFQKICNRASKVLANNISPKKNVLLLKPQNKVEELLAIILEPYSRKYGINIIYSNSRSIESIESVVNNKKNKKNKDNIPTINQINYVALPLTLNKKVKSILSNIFSGNELKDEASNFNDIKIIYPFINVSDEWINGFLSNKDNKNNKCNDNIKYNENIKNIKSESNENSDNNKNISLNDYKYNDNAILKKENPKNNIPSEIIANSFMEFLENIVPQYKENVLISSNFVNKYTNIKNRK